METICPEKILDCWEITCTTKLANSDHYYTKPQTDAKIAEMSGATPEQVQEMINASLEGYYDKSQMDTTVGALEASDGVISGAVDNVSSALTQESQRALNAESSINDILATKADSSAVTEEISAAIESKADITAVTEAILEATSGKADSDSVYTKSETDSLLDVKADSSAVTEAISAAVVNKADSTAVTQEISAAVSGKADTTAVTQEISTAVSGKADTTAVTEAISAATSGKANADSVYTKSETDSLLNNKADSTAVTQEISAAVSGKADTTAVTEAISTATSGKADTSAVTEAISAAVSGKADSDSVYTKSETDTLLNGKQNTLVAGDNITISGNVISATGGSGGVTSGEVQTMIDQSVSGKADSSNVYTKAETDDEISAAVNGKQDTLVSGTNIKTINNESILGSGNINIQGGSGITSAECQSMIDSSISGKANSDAVYTKVETDSLLDAKLDTSAYTPTDLSNYYTKSETSGSTEISNALSNKQDTLVSGTNIKTINNESILGSGNINIQGGSGISSAECQTMIDNSISGKADSSSVYTKTEVDSALSGKASTATTQTLSNTLGTHTADTTIHVTSQEKNTWNGKQNALSAGSGITITNNTVSAKIWSGTRTEWGQISGNTQADMIYFVYE